jgi:hypothetical protein
MRIALAAPAFEPVPPARHGGTERTVALLCDALARRGHDVTLFASGDSRVPVPLVAPIARALRSEEHSTDPTAATLVQLGEVYDRASAFDVIHNHVGPLAFPFARCSATPTLTTAYDRLDRVEVRRAFEAFLRARAGVRTAGRGGAGDRTFRSEASARHLSCCRRP